MASNREIIAREIVRRYVEAISGTAVDQIIKDNPNNKIYVGRLSPQSAADDFSSNVLIKQISVDFRIPKGDIDVAEIEVFPQGNFFFRVFPSLTQQREAFWEDFKSTFTEIEPANFDEIVMKYNSGELDDVMKAHKAPFLPVYEKIAIDREDFDIKILLRTIYDSKYECGSLSAESEVKKEIEKEIEHLCSSVASKEGVLPCQFRDKVMIDDLLSEDKWKAYINKQIAREEFKMYPKFAFDIAVELKGTSDFVDVTVALSNETMFGDESTGFWQEAAKSDPYRINTLFNSGIRVKVNNSVFTPIELDYFANDYKYDRCVYALGNNCNVEYDSEKMEIQTVHVPMFIQNRLKTNDKLAVKFADLVSNPTSTLNSIYGRMVKEIQNWRDDLNGREDLTTVGRRQFENEISAFELEVKRFKTGIELINKYNMIRDAFVLMNRVFYNSAKGYDSWRMFQIVFVVSLILDVTAYESDLMLDDEIKVKAKTDDIDILYFPTGGGKTEAFLGILIFNLFFDRLRGKECGNTAFLKYPLRLLSVQQVQRVSNILATAEVLRRDEQLGGEEFSLGYFVGEGNTPNKIDGNKELEKALLEMSPDELDEKYRLLDVCPFCKKEAVHVVYDEKKKALRHICSNSDCQNNGHLPLYMVDDDIYRVIPSVIISTVDKMTAIGQNMRFHNLLCGAKYKCSIHGYTSKNRCLVSGCKCNPEDFRKIEMKDPAPSLLIQDELHLIKESLGAYDAHYETLVEYFVKGLSSSNRGLKVIGATATISAYAEQAKHLYWKNAIRFPSASPYLDHNFYSKIDPDDIGRIIVGYAPFGKAIVNSVAYSLQYLKRVINDLFKDPNTVLGLDGINIQGNEEEKIQEVKKLAEDYYIILEYNNVKMESNKVLQAIEDPINTELISENIEPLVAKKMTGDDTFQDVRSTLSAIEHAQSVVNDLEFNMIAATSMISHGVDADRFNLMLFYGMPGNTAEYIQAYSRVGRKHPGIVIDIMRPSREKDQSYLKNFVKFHEYKDILVDSVSINRWATKAVESTLPGVICAILLNYYMYELQYTPGMSDISKYKDLRKAFQSETITADDLKRHAYSVYKCSENDSSIGKLYKETIDKKIDELVDSLKSGDFDGRTYITEVFNRCYFHVMRSLRDTDQQIIVEMK